MQVFFSVGEPSGDLHGANLVRALRARRPDVRCVGYGGPRMAAAGCDLHYDLTELAVMWLTRVLAHLPTFLWLLWRADRFLMRERPDAVVLIDYPGFNWWIARRAKARGIPVFYYGVPQLWAWAPWRVRKMRRLVDHALCKLPFEEPWYGERGCRATFIGHPYFDQMRDQVLDPAFLETCQSEASPLVTILPGSRTQEVIANLPDLLRAAARVRAAVPQVRLAIASFNARQAALARRLVAEQGVEATIHIGRTPELIHAARCCLACSGSVSLELLHHTKPSVILYRVSRLLYNIGWYLLIRVRYITLVNLLAAERPFERGRTPYDPDVPGAERVPLPQYPTYEDKSEALANHVIRWLRDPVEWEARVAQLADLKARFARPGASERAAEYLLQHVATPEAAASLEAAGTSPRRAA